MPSPRPVLLAPASAGAVTGVPDLGSVAKAATAAAGDVDAALWLARDLATTLPLPGSGATRALWEALASLGAADLTVARVVEPHLDALAVLAQVEADGLLPDGALDAVGVDDGATWGVYAAEGPGARLEAHPDRDASGHEVALLTGRKPWCSLAGRVSHALVTAWCGPDERRLYAVDLRHAGVTVATDVAWAARGLTAVTSGPVDLVDVPAVPVGPPGWYLHRPGFAWGGIGVAAIWFGGAVGVARRLAEQAARREPDQLALAHLGAVDGALHAARAALAEAAAVVDATSNGTSTGVDPAVLALRTRQVVARAAETVLEHVAHALGPAPLTLEDEHARRVADLQVYVRQEHAERDQATLGRLLLQHGDAPTDGPAPW
ncbi:alkylation response protein AidB-like acyl-CoA dehydrogenase [Terracoccus luteus]|uniref:Alkylation response protein AidB-like acyl-CoA dehydrogenase n=1 Tax=Terracoccus luteus TaxID=53356 RepID=A0A495XW52_9MICO|nr:acyl-CoA dehydrogenase [Terracoccus luteus]RKT78801.1 alkylation response protein AidB-like acyl-CoA dehydrogenase [Terracoccus luteus]